MARCKFGGLLLIVLLALCLLVTWAARQCHEPISQELELAAEQVLAGDWDRAVSLAGNARQQWDGCWHFTASMADHGPMESIDGQFAQLQIYLRTENPAAAVVCADLARQIEAIFDAHRPSWWNLL